MKKSLIILLVAFISIPTFAQRTYSYTYSATQGDNSSSEYYLDRKLSEHKSDPVSAGLISRFGYGFNYDAFTYGISFYYQWSRLAGITAGFDGYFIPDRQVQTIDGEIHQSSEYSLPLWNIRAGFMLSKYFLFGGMFGKVDKNFREVSVLNLQHSQWFTTGENQGDFLYGGFVTFVLPISKYVGLNLDFAVTNKTGFNVGMGVNATIPIK